MTVEKVISHIEEEIRKVGLGTPPNKIEIRKVLTGLSLLMDNEADPESVFVNKFHVVLDDLASDVRSSQ
jgi:hypothetical protein